MFPTLKLKLIEKRSTPPSFPDRSSHVSLQSCGLSCWVRFLCVELDFECWMLCGAVLNCLVLCASCRITKLVCFYFVMMHFNDVHLTICFRQTVHPHTRPASLKRSSSESRVLYMLHGGHPFSILHSPFKFLSNFPCKSHCLDCQFSGD